MMVVRPPPDRLVAVPLVPASDTLPADSVASAASDEPTLG
jgi:hypothetical protein